MPVVSRHAALEDGHQTLALVEGRRAHLGWAAGVAVCLLILLGAAVGRHGASVTPDSVQYLSTAHHVASGEGVRTSITELSVPPPMIPLGPWPPLYPILLGGLMRAGLTPYESVRWLNLVLLPLAIWPLALVARRAGGPRSAAATVLAHALLFYPVMLSAFVWSEPLYIVLSLASLACLGRGMAREKGFAWEMPMGGLLAGAAMLTRYVGFTLIGASLAGLWLLSLHRPPRRFWRDLLGYAIPAILPNALWLWHNRRATGYFFGEARPEAWFPWDRILADTGRTLALDWMAPILRLDMPWAPAAGLAGFAGAAILLGVVLSRLRLLRAETVDEQGGLTFILWLYAAAYIFGMILLSRRVGFDPVNTRYLAPAYPPLLVLLAALMGKALAGERRRRPQHLERNLLATALLLLAVPQVASTARLVARAGMEERGLTGPYWTSSAWDDASWDADPGLDRVRAYGRDGALIISNLWDLIGIRTGLATKALPETTWPGFLERLWEHPGAVVAVHRGMRPYRATDEDLRALAGTSGRLAPLGETGKWSFYRVTPPAEVLP